MLVFFCWNITVGLTKNTIMTNWIIELHSILHILGKYFKTLYSKVLMIVETQFMSVNPRKVIYAITKRSILLQTIIIVKNLMMNTYRWCITHFKILDIDYLLLKIKWKFEVIKWNFWLWMCQILDSKIAKHILNVPISYSQFVKLDLIFIFFEYNFSFFGFNFPLSKSKFNIGIFETNFFTLETPIFHFGNTILNCL